GHSFSIAPAHTSQTSRRRSSGDFCFGGSGRKLRRNSCSISRTMSPFKRSSKILCALRASLALLILYHPFPYLVLNPHPPKKRHLPTCPDCGGMPHLRSIH